MVIDVDSLLLVKSHGDLSKLDPPLPSFVLPSSPILIHSFLLGLFVFLLYSGDFFSGQVAHRPPVSTVDGGVLSRLLTPTQASLARSKSAAALSAEGKDAPGNLRVGDPDKRRDGKTQT